MVVHEFVTCFRSPDFASFLFNKFFFLSLRFEANLHLKKINSHFLNEESSNYRRAPLKGIDVMFIKGCWRGN